MTAPYWLVALVCCAAFVASAVASMLASIGGKARGESLLKTWTKQVCAGLLAMVAVFAAYFAILGLVRLLAS